MGRRGHQRRKEDTFPYFVLLGVVVVALLAGVLINGTWLSAPKENVAGQAFLSPTAQVEVCGRTIYLDGPATHKELYSRIGTGTPVKISGPLQSDGTVYKFAVTPDGQYALYLARMTVADPQPSVHLYRVSINGGEVLRLNNPLPDNAQVNDVAISPDSQYVAYTADLGQVGGHAQFDLYTVPITGGVATRRTTVAIQNDVWPGVIFTPDSQRVVYATHNTVSGDGGLYSAARTSGSSITLVNPEDRVDRDKFAVSCDSQTAYFFTDPVGSSRHLYSIPIMGGTSTPLTGTELPTLNCPAPPAPTCGNTNTGTPHVFIDDRDTPNKDELYSENIATGVITKISGTIPNDEDVTSFQVTTNGQRVVYRVGKQFAEGTYTGGNWQLYSVPTTGGTAVRISGPMQPQGGVGLFRVAPDGTRVAYTADATNNTAMELYSVPILGGTVSSLSGPMRVYFDSPSLITSNVISLFISPDSQRVVYTADMEEWTMYEAYSVPITGGAKTRINHVLPADHDVEGIVIAPNSQRVVYRAVRTSLGKGELYSVPITGGTAVRISQPWNPPTSTIDVEFGPEGLGAVVSCDSQIVYYLADAHGDGSRDELYSVPIGGGTITPLTGSALPTITCVTNNTNACSAIGAVCATNANCCSNACSNSHCVSMNPGSGNSSAPAGFAPATDPIDGATYLAASTSASGVQVSANGNNGRYVWRIGYYLKDAQWQPFQFSAAGIAGTNWTNGSLNAALPTGAPASGYAIIYACKKYPGRTNYTCGPRNATSPSSERRWTIVEYQTTTTGCTDDCATGATMCASTQVRLCGNYDTDTCREWSNAQNCPTGQTCQGSACATTGGGNGDTRPLCSTQPRTACSASQFAGSSPRSDLSCRCQISPCPPPQQCYQCPEGQSAVYSTTTHTYSCAAGGGGTGATADRYMGGIDGLDWSARVQNGVQTGFVCNTAVNCTGYDASIAGCYVPGAHYLAWACAYGSGQTSPALYKCDASHNNQEMSTGGTNKVCCKQTGSTYAFETGPCVTTSTEERHGVDSPIDPTKSSCWDGVDNDQDGALDVQGGAGTTPAEGTDCYWPWNADIEAPASVVKGSTFSVWCSSTFGWQFTQHAGPKLSGSGGTMNTFAVWDATKGKYRSDFTASATCTHVTVICGTDKASIVTTNPLAKNLEARIPCQDPMAG